MWFCELCVRYLLFVAHTGKIKFAVQQDIAPWMISLSVCKRIANKPLWQVVHKNILETEKNTSWPDSKLYIFYLQSLKFKNLVENLPFLVPDGLKSGHIRLIQKEI